MNRNKIVYYASTGVLTAIMLFSVFMYLTQHEMVAEMFTGLGFPTWIIYPLAAAKILGLIAIWTRASTMLKEWAYAGFFFDVLLAIGAHLSISDGGQWMAVGALVMIIVSRIQEPKI